MVVCANCGAENQETSQLCRMCVTPLSVVYEANQQTIGIEEPASTVIDLSRSALQIKCAQCAALNEISYNFCQACGAKLNKAESLEEGRTLDRNNDSNNLSQTPTVRAPSAADAYNPSSGQVSSQAKAPQAKPQTFPCPHCAKEIVPDSVFCNHCGTRLSVEQTVAMRSPKPAPKAYVRLIVDGEESDSVYELGSTTAIGRVKGELTFPFDDYMSSTHASLTRRGNTYLLKDEGSRNGTLVKINGEVELKPGDVFMVGRQLFKFEAKE
jgi:predicted amidophosphoribosyltransferase